MAQGKILPYLDIPFQHADPEVLRRMKRPASAEKVLDRIHAWRKQCPDLTIRSTFIAGFPGETEAQFQTLLDFLTEAQIDRLGCFAYSPVEGAAANALDGALPDEVRQERQDRLMAHQEHISAQRLARWRGRRIQALVDGFDTDEGCLIARGPGDAPDIDGIIRVHKDLNSRHAIEVEVGAFIEIEVTDSDSYDLEAVFVRSISPASM
jgi:ribosomal protein S12 methylthiotransferase